MWFSRKYNSTDTHLYTFCMTSQQDWYLVPSGGELHVCYLPGDQSENENIRFVVHDKRWMIKSRNAPVPYPTMNHFVTEMCTGVHISVTKWCIVGYLSDAWWVCGMGRRHGLLCSLYRFLFGLQSVSFTGYWDIQEISGNIKQMPSRLCLVSNYRQISNISRFLGCNKIVDHSHVVGASSADGSPTTSSFSTYNGLDKDNCITSRETFKFCDWVCHILDVWRFAINSSVEPL